MTAEQCCAAELSDLFYQCTNTYKSADVSNNFETFKPDKKKKKNMTITKFMAGKNKTQLT